MQTGTDVELAQTLLIPGDIGLELNRMLKKLNSSIHLANGHRDFTQAKPTLVGVSLGGDHLLEQTAGGLVVSLVEGLAPLLECAFELVGHDFPVPEPGSKFIRISGAGHSRQNTPWHEKCLKPSRFPDQTSSCGIRITAN